MITNSSRAAKKIKLDDRGPLAKRMAREALVTAYDGADAFPHVSPGADLPPFRIAVAVTVRWQLKTPFHSRADNAFDIVDNPIARDRLTGQPILKASGAKGMIHHEVEEEEGNFFKVICGTALDSATGSGVAGNTIFGDVIYDKVGMDMISPHMREHGVADHPVYFEVVPADANGEWGFLVWARDPLAPDAAAKVKRSLLVILNNLKNLVSDIGMSAKRTK